MNMFLEGLKIVLESCGSLIIVIVGAFVVYGLKLLCKKMGIELNDNDYNTIIAIVKQVIKYLDQKFVDSIKNNSPDGKLTDQQQLLIKTKAVELIEKLLSAEQVQYLLTKYKLDNIDDIIDILIESTMKEARTETDTTGVIINEDTLDSIDEKNKEDIPTECVRPSEFELQSLAVCAGDCKVCGLHCKWCRCSKCIENK